MLRSRKHNWLAPAYLRSRAIRNRHRSRCPSHIPAFLHATESGELPLVTGPGHLSLKSNLLQAGGRTSLKSENWWKLYWSWTQKATIVLGHKFHLGIPLLVKRKPLTSQESSSLQTVGASDTFSWFLTALDLISRLWYLFGSFHKWGYP